ncbi:MAG TPA: plastocyanin/azurin family copper-binding protein [Chitinophagaceae bacterium]|nr:plastocyanin/azurin family copper-binding protein [Chitinophagaceae bacterium]
MKAKNFFITCTLVYLTLFIGFSCSKSGAYSNSGSPGGSITPNGISMTNMTFSPASKTVAMGTVVTWTNNDPYAHTVTSNDGTSFNSGTINGGATYSYTASVAGTFAYHCTIHGLAMSGTLIVTP